MSRLIKAAVKPLNQLYNQRQHLKRPIPRSLEVRTTGKVLTADEWSKFYSSLTHKLQDNCEQRKDGTMLFFGEYGLEAATLLQNLKKYQGRFHFVLSCDSKNTAIQSLQTTQVLGLEVSELHYKNDRHEIIVSDKRFLEQMLLQKAS